MAKVIAVNRVAHFILTDDDETYPITTYYDAEGWECEEPDAVSCTAGREGIWYSVLLTGFASSAVH